MPLVSADQGGPRAFGNRLLRHVLLVGRHRVRLDHGVILVVEIEEVRGNSHAHRVAFAAVTVYFHSHHKPPRGWADGLAVRIRRRSLDPKTRTCYNREGRWVPIQTLGRGDADRLHPGAGGIAPRAAVLFLEADDAGALRGVERQRR